MIDLKLNDNNIKDFEKLVQAEMDKALKFFERDIVSIRTGRAHASLVEPISVLAYGSNTMRLKEVASISIPEARLIIIQPWDRGLISDIEKAINNSDLGLTPVNDGNVIRITIPEMSSARREELVKVLHKKLEESRIAIRNVRKDFHNLIRDSEKAKHISEDHSRRLNDLLQKTTDKFIQAVESIANKKENEIKTI